MKAKHIKKKSKKSIFQTLIIIILSCIFVYSAIQVGIWLKSNFDLDNLEKNLYKDVSTNNEENGMKIDFEKLQSINPDVIGWINIENTNINYPILQGETDDFYLRKDIYKNYSYAGSIFLDSTTNPEFTQDNTVIYGHNLKLGKMFSQLTKIYNGELGKDVVVEIYTKKEKNNYKVFSAYMGEQDLAITQRDFEAEEKQQFINEAIKKSNYKFNVEVDTNKEIITLITCDKTGEKRIVVNAVKNN